VLRTCQCGRKESARSARSTAVRFDFAILTLLCYGRSAGGPVSKALVNWPSAVTARPTLVWHPQRDAFNWIELLVVMVFALATLLLPALSHARAKALSSKSQCNLCHVGSALKLNVEYNGDSCRVADRCHTVKVGLRRLVTLRRWRI
jgi:hypothetical protein